MANSNAYQGFQPYRHTGGGRIRSSGYYKIQSAYATNLFTGDPVVLTSGYLARAANNSGTIIGIFSGVRFRDSSLTGINFRNYWPASTATLNSEDAQAYVFDDPMISYRCQCSVDLAYVDATHKMGGFALVLTNAGSTATGFSGAELNLNDSGVAQFLVLGLIDEPSNAVGLNAKVEVLVRKAQLKVN